MANVRFPVAECNAGLDAMLDRVDLGSGAATLSFYTSPLPLPDAAISTQTLLGTVTMSDPAWGAASGRVKSANAITEANAVATGIPAFARMRDSAGNTRADFTCGVADSGAACILAAETMIAGLPIEIISLSITMPSGA